VLFSLLGSLFSLLQFLAGFYWEEADVLLVDLLPHVPLHTSAFFIFLVLDIEDIKEVGLDVMLTRSVVCEAHILAQQFLLGDVTDETLVFQFLSFHATLGSHLSKGVDQETEH